MRKATLEDDGAESSDGTNQADTLPRKPSGQGQIQCCIQQENDDEAGLTASFGPVTSTVTVLHQWPG